MGHRAIAEGRAVLERALALGGRGSYVIQAAIASLQASDPIDWPQIAALYGELARRTGSPVVELNLAVAIAETGALAEAFVLVDGLVLDGYPYWHSTRGEPLRPPGTRGGGAGRLSARWRATSSGSARSSTPARCCLGACGRGGPPRLRTRRLSADRDRP